MTVNIAVPTPDAEAEIRWHAWQARGVEGDRRRATIMRRVVAVVAIGLASWFTFQLF